MQEEPQTPLPRGAIVCLSLAAFGSGVALRINDPLLPRLAREFGIGVGEAAQVISLFAIAYGLAQLMFGPLGDRFGKYRVIACATVACTLASLLCALAPGFAELRLARLLAGMTAAAIIPLSMAWIGDVVDYAERQPVLARFLIGQIVGLSAGVALGGFAADHLSWRVPYVLLTVFFACIALALFTIDRRLPARARLQRAGEGGSALARIVDDFGHVLAQPWARMILLTVYLEGVCLYGPFAFFATHLHERLGLSLSAAGLVVMLFGAGGFIYAMAARRLVGALGESGLALGGGLLMVAALVTMALTPSWLLALPVALATGLGFYMMHNTLQLNATQMAPARRGAAVASFASCFFLGQSTGVALSGQLVGRIGTPWLFSAGAAGLLLVSLAFTRRLRRRERMQAAAAA
ncbi:MFS transporter [Pelomonas sp. KK5]|uniref:MFS transporter n=1 Tax=Pelomonas sp. KK5 TaxID=1855730 RepID=UPI00097C2E59|nr:MFS transporter [Pelomonas sp. KK5]